MSNNETKELFLSRSKILDSVRTTMKEAEFMEVETPMMHSLPGGAVARPFITKHNALNRDLYLRIAPELHLKRLLVGGFDKVFEINRSFRNEGLSTKHNPEFTMLEFYAAHEKFDHTLNFVADIIKNATECVGLDLAKVEWDKDCIDLNNFVTKTMRELVLENNSELAEGDLKDLAKLTKVAESKGIKVEEGYGWGKVLLELFEKTVEAKLIQPTFVTEYPVEVSPLSRRSNEDPDFADRFELFIGGKELANGFCELNDPEDQASRFQDQVEAGRAGDKEAMSFDQDYITALEHGMPPAVGVGIGIDRMVMMITNSSSIKDVILFPQMKD
jgi:lysyl-tRNA synthetase class 2